MKQSTLNHLKQLGWRFEIHHNRPSYPGGELAPKGGITEVVVITPSGLMVIGSARCSESDNYNKRIGTCIAAGRAYKTIVTGK